MSVLSSLYYWTDIVLFWGLVALWIWAFVDCAGRKAATFPAANRMTKPAWLAITGFSGVLGILVHNPVHIISLIAVIASSVYLADVRPAVREISGGGGGW